MDPARDDTAIDIKGLRKTFGPQTVLAGIELQVRQGETVVVLGRSGTGKSVLLKLLVGLQKPDAGSIHVHGSDITQLADRELNAVRAHIGFLFQEAALYDSMSVEENVAFPLKHGRAPKTREGRAAETSASPDARVNELLQFVGMADAKQKMPSEISGGMRKRVGLARALALDPDILLFDEPTAGLDPITATEIEDLILKLQKERHVASVVVTHDLRGARRIANRLAFLDEGSVVFDGSFEDAQHSTQEFVAHFLREAS